MDPQAERLISRLRRNVNDIQAYTELKNYYRQRRDFLSLLNLVEGWAEQSRDYRAASNAYYEAAEMALQKIDNPERAKTLLQNALQSNPLNTKASESLESLLNEAGDFHELAGLLDHQIRNLESSRADPKYLALLEYRLAALWNNQFQHPHLALDHYYRAIQFDPTLLIAIYEAREICLRQGDLEKAADLNQMEADAETTRERKVALFRELAALYSTDLNDLNNAVNALRSAARIAPDDVFVMQDLANCLVQRASTKGPQEAIADYRRASELFFQIAQKSPNESAWKYLESALGYDPTNEKALTLLETLAEEMGRRHLLPPFWVEYIAEADDGPLVNQRRVDLAKVYLEAGQETDAIFCLHQAGDHGDAEAVRLLNDFYLKSGRTPVKLDIDALTKAAQSDQPAANEPVTRSGPPPDFIPPSESVDMRALEPVAVSGGQQRSAKVPGRDDEVELIANEVEALDLELEIEEATPFHLDIDFEALAKSDETQETKTEIELSESDALAQSEASVKASPATQATNKPLSVTALKNRLMKKRLAQQKQRTVPEPNSQSERAAEPKDYKPKLPPPLLTEPKFESLSDLQPRQEPTQNEGLPAVSVTAAASAQEASPPDELETKGEKVRSTLPPPFRRQKHGKLEEATEEDTAQADEIIEPAAPESGVEGQLDTLCKQMQQAVAAREDERAETISREILQIAPGNPQAYSFLETRYRRKQQYQELRELLLRSTQDPELSLDNRKLRLREAAGISQNKLKDIDGAIENWNSLLNLDPDDGNAKQALKRLLQSVERWDELVAMLDKEAMGTSDSELEADLIEQIVLLQREKRHDKEEEIIALRQLHALRPNDKEVRNSLCDALLEVGRAREAISFLRERIAESKDGRTAVQLLYRLASLLESDVADIEQAYQAYRQIFAISAEERRALDNLERIDEQLGRFDRLLKTLELRVATEPKEKLAELYARMSAVAENELSDLNTAADYLNQALDLEPGNNQTLTKLLDLFERSERYDEMVELLRERVRLEKDQEKQVALYRRIGSLLADKLEDEEAAAKIYRTIIRIKADIDALRFLRLYALKHDDAKRLVAVLEKLIEVETDPKECRDLLYEYGRILNTRMKRPKEAIAVLQRLLKEFDPRFEPAIDELLVASEKIGNPSLLVEALERQLAIEPDAKAKADLARRIAELYQLEIKQPQGTISALHEWMRLDADNPEPRRRLSELMEKAGSHAELIPVLDELAVLETKEEKRNDAAIKASQLLFEKLHDPEGAWNRLVPLVERGVFKADDAISSLAVKSNRLDALCDLFERTGKYRKLIEILSRQAEVEKDPQKRLAFYRRIARDRFERLQDERGAAQAWQHVLEVGEDVEALEFLRQQAIRNDDVEQLTDILGRLAPLEINAGERRDLMFDRAQLLTTRLGRPQESIAILRDILDTLDPKYQPAIDALISACEAAGDIKGLAAALERQLDMERHSDARAQLARRLSEIYLSDLKDSQAAIRALWLWGQAESINPEPYRRLRALLQQTDRFEELIAVLDELAQLETDETHGIEAALSAADLTYRRLMDTDGAWRRLATLVEKGCEAADQALIRIATETNRLGDLYDVFERAEKYHALVALLHREVSAEKDAEKRVELHRRIARLLTDRLQDSSAATEAWRSLLEIRDDKEALGALRFEVAKSDDAEALADIIKRMAALETDGAERRDLLFEHARLLNERLNRSGEAVEILKQILELDPRFEPAIDQFVAAAEALGDQASIADALERQLAINREAKTRADLARRLAELYLLENNPKRAIAALMVWAQAEPKDPEPRRELRGLLEKARRYRELVAVLDELSEMEPETEAQIETALAAAEFAHKKLRDLEGAWNRYIPLLRHRVSRAEEALRKIARESRREKQLASIYTALAQQSTEAELSAAHWYHAAEIFETDLNQPEQALEAALRRLALDLANTSYLEEVERLAVKVNAWPRLAQVYSRMVAQTEEKRDKVALLVRYADLLDEKAKDAAAAQKTILQASALDPDNEQLLDRAQELSLLANDTHEFYEAFERRYQNASSDSERVRYLLRVAQIVDTRLRDREQTKELIKRAVKLTLNAPELAEQIESAARAMDKERPDSAESNLLRTVVEGYQALLSNRNDKHDTARVLRTARLLSGELKDDSSAFDVLRRGLSRYPADREIYQEAERVAVKIRRLDALDALLARALNQTMDKDTTILILENRARLIKDRLNRYDEAAEVYQIILDLDPEHGEARQSLLSCLEKGGRYLELVRMMEKQCSAISDPHAQLELMKQIAVIWEQQLLNLWEAIEVWKKIQEAAPDDAAAAEALQRLQQVSLPSIRPKK